MSNQRTLLAGLVTALLAASGSATGNDFNTRMAAWQSGGPPAASRAIPPAAQPTAPQAAPQAAAPPPQARVLAETYSAPASPLVHGSPVGPMAHSGPQGGCASCGTGGEFGGDYMAGYNPGGACCGLFCGPGLCGPRNWLGGCNSCGGFNGCCGCGGCDSCGGCEADWCNNTMVWARFDVLLWWRQGRDFPVLVTSDPVIEASTTAGILPDAQTVFGGRRVGTEMEAGGRFDIGWWCDPQHCVGYGWRFFGLGRDDSQFNINSNQNPILAIPFTDNATGTNDALLVAYPGLRTGSISIRGSADLVGNDLYGRYLLCRDPNSRLDFITGWHYNRIADNIEISSTSTVTEVGGNIPNGTVTDIRDSFEARSEFNGGILGLMWEQDCGCWSLQWLARMSIGNMHETMRITGSSTIAVPTQTPVTTPSGLFATGSNAGQYSRDEFTAVTEAGLTFNYRFAPCTQFSVGYTFIYWNDVLSPGKGIDTVIGTTTGGNVRPQFVFRHSDYWVQGISLGLTQEF